MSSSVDRSTGKVFEEPSSVILVATGMLVLQAGTGVQVLWLIVLGGVAVLSALVDGRGAGTPTRAPEPHDRSR